ncbi:hypothetical protein OAN61_01000 [bacterium]|nr:hypothetical protein [bacterium]
MSLQPRLAYGHGTTNFLLPSRVFPRTSSRADPCDTAGSRLGGSSGGGGSGGGEELGVTETRDGEHTCMDEERSTDAGLRRAAGALMPSMAAEADSVSSAPHMIMFNMQGPWFGGGRRGRSAKSGRLHQARCSLPVVQIIAAQARALHRCGNLSLTLRSRCL